MHLILFLNGFTHSYSSFIYQSKVYLHRKTAGNSLPMSYPQSRTLPLCLSFYADSI
jgi:hypothetical protein